MPVSRFLIAVFASASMASAALPAQDIALPPELEKLYLADEECEDHDLPHMVEARAAGKLDGSRSVYLLPCFSGAYNVIYRIYVYDSRHPEAVQHSQFAAYSDQLGWYGRSTVINAHYDAATRTLTAFEKGRGLGDCGSQPTWLWSEFGWRLMEYRYWDKCDGTRMPADWPVVYRYTPPK